MFSIAFPQTGRLTAALCDFIFITGCHGESMKMCRMLFENVFEGNK